MTIQQLFADRIGGSDFGKVGRTFKFTLIDTAKKGFIRQNPSIKVIDMGVGEPEERACDEIATKLYHEALLTENRIYSNNGTLDFKEAAARYLKRLLDLEFVPDKEIVHCLGTKTALAQLPFAFINPGDAVMATVPGYPVLPTIATWLGARVLPLKLTAEHNFLPNLNEVEDFCKKYAPKLLLLNYPNNPTGAVADLTFYSEVVNLANRYNFVLIQDAAYADLNYDSPYTSPHQAKGGKDVTIELYSLSKSYNMQGYRLGFVVSNPALLSAYALVKDNMDNGQFLATQKAGVEALDNQGDFLRRNRQKYKQRLHKTSQLLNRIGFSTRVSPGTFYLYARVPDKFHGLRFETAQAMSDYLTSKFGVVTVPWDDAGPYLRFSMTFEIDKNNSQAFSTEDQLFAVLEERLLGRPSV